MRVNDDEYAFTTRYVSCDINMSDDINEYANMTNHVSDNDNMSDWIVDSGATSHMTPERSCFHSYHLISPKGVILGDDTVLEAVGKGQIVVDQSLSRMSSSSQTKSQSFIGEAFSRKTIAC